MYRDFSGDSVLELHGEVVYQQVICARALLTAFDSSRLPPLARKRYSNGAAVKNALRFEAFGLFKCVLMSINLPEIIGTQWAEFGIAMFEAKIQFCPSMEVL